MQPPRQSGPQTTFRSHRNKGNNYLLDRQVQKTETFTGRYDRNGSKIYSKVVDLGALPNTTSATDAHGVTGLDVAKRIILEGWCENGSSVVHPMPCTIGANLIDLKIDATNVTCTTNFDASGYTGEVRIEYCKT